ncbi:D-2-hydroxyacid dehydrogenase [Paenibacillaceae bacterium WGS1546]|uniref:D-2-hydroxyacid dehydrogenase n=1 Tax=Cohnella sp. WGS1546 TaxID=3366810 RepID=UPI00372D4348
MKIVVLDGYLLNPGDLSWTELEKLGEVVVYDRTPAELIVERASGAEIVLTNKTPLREAAIERLPELRYIGVIATGYDNVDVQAAHRRGIAVTNVPAYSSASVAQLVFALLLELCHRVGLHSDAVRGGEWSQAADFSFWRTPLVELEGRTMGIVGLGDIGRRAAKLALAFGMKVVAVSRTRRKLPDELAAVEEVGLADAFARSDVLSLHCPLTEATKGIINRDSLAAMKRSAFLINTGRGGLVVEEDLAEALRNGTIAGAGLDVLSAEPPPADHPLLRAPNCIITPHIAWATLEARTALMNGIVRNVERFLAGEPENTVG